MNLNKSEIYKNKLNLILFTISRGIFLTSLLVTGILTSRLLGPENRGEYSLFFTSVGLGLNFTNLGLSQSSIFFLNKKRKTLSEITGNSLFYIALILFIGILLCSFLEITNISLINYEILIDNKFLLLLCIVCGLLDSSLSGIIFGIHRIRLQSLNQIFLSTSIIFATLLIFFFNNSEQAILLRTIALVFHIFFFSYLFLSKIHLKNINLNLFLLKKQLSFGLKNWIQNLIGLINNKGTIFLVASFSNFSELGLLSVSLLFSEIIRFIPDTIGTLLLPRLTASKDNNEPKYLTAKLCRITLFIVLIISIFIAFNLHLIINIIFGKEYLLALIPSLIIIFGAIFSSIYQLLTRFFTSQHMQKYSIYSSLIGFLISIVTGFLTIPSLGSIGGALSYAFCNLSTCIFMIFFFTKYTKIKPYKLLILSIYDIKTIYNLF